MASAEPRGRNVRISDTVKDPKSDISEEADGESEGYGESELDEGNFADRSEEPRPKESRVSGIGALSKQMAQSFA